MTIHLKFNSLLAFIVYMLLRSVRVIIERLITFVQLAFYFQETSDSQNFLGGREQKFHHDPLKVILLKKMMFIKMDLLQNSVHLTWFIVPCNYLQYKLLNSCSLQTQARNSEYLKNQLITHYKLLMHLKSSTNILISEKHTKTNT